MERKLGDVVHDWVAAPRPGALHLHGHRAQLDPLDAAVDAPALWPAFAAADWVWDYLFEAPPADFAAFSAIMAANAARPSQPCYIVREKGATTPLGYACFWTVVPQTGVIEIGNVNFAPALQQTPIATEAFFLMADWAFSNGYRRVEWKCNALNLPSRRAAQRLGFSFEGVFRQHAIIKGRNRDTAWFAATDADWENLRQVYMSWLADDNFDEAGRQRNSLSALTAPYLVATDPAF